MIRMRPKSPSKFPVVRSESIKKNVAAIHTSGELSLLERKLTNVLLLNAYEKLLTTRTHKVPMKILCAMVGFDSNDTEAIKSALRKIVSTAIEFNVLEDGKEVWRTMSMLSFGEIRDGICTYRYDEFLAERLYDPEIYATINMAVQRKFESGYALTLYENCLRYKSVGSTGWWDIEKFRRVMGATAAIYDEFKYLKRDVITKPMEQVNRIADIRIEAEFRRAARKISSVRFLVRESAQQSLLKPDVADEYPEIRKNPTFLKLRDHGIGERLAIAWVINDEERAQSVVDYVEEKDKNQQVKGSTAGYIRTLIEDGAELGKTPYQKTVALKKIEVVESRKEEENQQRMDELRADFKRIRTTEAVKALLPERLREFSEAFAKEAGTKSDFDPATGDFKDRFERIKFRTWLRLKVAPGDPSPQEFQDWLQGRGGAQKALKAEPKNK
jgi:hypothetical protein